MKNNSPSSLSTAKSRLPQSGTAPARDQAGVALIIVIFVMAIVMIIAGSMARQQNLFVKRSTNQFIQMQAVELALGAEAFARQVLKQDSDDDRKNKKIVDHEKEIWAEYAAALPLELGTIEVQIDDLQGRFNLNELVDANGKVVKEQVLYFQALLDRLAIESINAEKVVDWIDQDDESYQYKGAEEDAYLIYETPYRTANSWFAHESELRLIDGITVADYQLLLPHISTLPTGSGGVNLNTCSKELLMAISEKVSEADAESVLELRKEDYFESVDEMFQLDALRGVPRPATGFKVNSEYFEISIRIQVADQVSRMVVQVHRDNQGKMTTLNRDQGQKYIITKEQVFL
ncbi:MAG: type II secretion system minor pseudopilin GspK [Pseudomonadales bacterium]|nr:type II secretion system minor pseudopilin GspK [Pseudomonadales bacterium]